MQKREKKRWLFRKPTTVQENAQTQPQPQPSKTTNFREATADQNHAAIAESAANEVVRVSRPPPKEHRAAVVIQTAFRGYLVSVKTQIYLYIYLN